MAREGKTVTTEPLTGNEHVADLIKILHDHNHPAAKDLTAILKQIGAMEINLEAAVKELTAMRQDLAEAQKQKHPVRNVLQKAVILMQGHILELREKLADLKQDFVDGCKNALVAFKEMGISALDNTARFFKIRPALESLRDGLTTYIETNNKTIDRIEAISKEYHEAGRHLKNIGRAMSGKEAIAEAKPPGMVVKIFTAPYRADARFYAAFRKNVKAAISILSRLEERAEKQPSIQETLKRFNKKVAQDKEKAPVREKPLTAGNDR